MIIELLFIPFAIIFLAVQLSDRKALRVIFSVITLLALAACGTMLRLAHNYGNTYIASAVEKLTTLAPEDQRECLQAASRQFRRERQAESPFGFSIAAASRLHRAVQQADLPLPKQDGEQDGTGQPATRPPSKSEGSDKPQSAAEGRSR